jgi:hypothetical protein
MAQTKPGPAKARRKEDPMRRIDLDSTPYYGSTRSVTRCEARRWPECRRCGSSLAGRLEQVRTSTATVGQAVEVFRCRCGRGRHVKREVATA